MDSVSFRCVDIVQEDFCLDAYFALPIAFCFGDPHLHRTVVELITAMSDRNAAIE